MSLLQGDELKRKVRVSIEFYLSTVIIACIATAVFTNMRSEDKIQKATDDAIYSEIASVKREMETEIKALENTIKELELHLRTAIKEGYEFSIEEVEGLRGDWGRDKEMQDSRINRLEDSHFN